jgi:ABC-type sulfate transport system substrate-binding protein
MGAFSPKPGPRGIARPRRAQLEQGRSHEQAVAWLQQLFTGVPVKEQPVDYVVPDSTMLIENPIAVVTRSKRPTAARAFVEYLRSPAAQRMFPDKGYRPVNAQVAARAEFPEPSRLFTIGDLGGWADVTKKFFDKEAGIVADIERRVGVSIGS